MFIPTNPILLVACRRADATSFHPHKLFVGGLHYATTTNSFRVYFESYGEVEGAMVVFNRETRKSRGFGFIIFKVRGC